MDATDAYTAGHSVRVGYVAGAIGSCLGLTPLEIRLLQLGGGLHDIGKLRVPAALIAKQGGLSLDEYRCVMEHTVLGERLLARIRGQYPTITAVVRWHHERIDGRGLPDGLAGAAIPLPARIVAVADAFDAMTSTRPYRGAVLSTDEAVAELERSVGTQFDGTCVRGLRVACRDGAVLETARVRAAQPNRLADYLSRLVLGGSIEPPVSLDTELG
ncbi:MAG: hypothetical protein A2W29_06410 [Gemmatimonadetes bacterium RBG_16_66_8]|nr:MAG: hypothetical protein A2W29_06410 [Gemmatimonadetes bacterium RBG_16_66_8]